MVRTSPNVSGSITHVQAEIVIDAPIEVVWNTIIDFPSYREWNPFIRSQAITDASYEPLPEHPAPSEGAYLLLKVRLPPKGLDDDDKGLTHAKNIITYVENHSIGWKQASYPNWLLKGQRWQDLKEIDMDGKKNTKYTSIETFNGPFAYIIKWFVIGKLATSFKAMTKGLKTRSEYLAKNS